MTSYQETIPLPLPAFVPTVIYDVDLKDYVSNLDFDYSAFDRLRTLYGVTDAEVEDYTIHFCGRNTVPRAFGGSMFVKHMYGQYAPKIKTTYINVPYVIKNVDKFFKDYPEIPKTPSPVAAVLNNVVSHETGHWEDDLHAKVFNRVVNRIKAEVLGAVACSSSVAMIAHNEISPWATAPTAIVSLIGSLGIMAESFNRAYPTKPEHPGEKVAHSFASAHEHNLASIAPKYDSVD